MGGHNVDTENVWWIDDKGHWLNFDATYVQRFPTCSFSQIEHRRSFLFDTLGIIKVSRYPRIIDIHWDVRHVMQGALSALLDHLVSLESPGNNDVMVALRFFFGAWNTELYTSPGNAAERIIELSEYANATPSDAITIANVDMAAIGSSHSSVRSCFDLWHGMGGILEDNPTLGLGELSNRTLVMGTDSLDERLVYKQVGPQSVACMVLGEDWRYIALGNTVEQCDSDDDYELEVVSDYPEVMELGEPRLDHIRAFFQLPGDDPIWLNYERLLLPWRAKNGKPLVMCFSNLNQNLSVPFLEAAIEDAA